VSRPSRQIDGPSDPLNGAGRVQDRVQNGVSGHSGPLRHVQEQTKDQQFTRIPERPESPHPFDTVEVSAAFCFSGTSRSSKTSSKLVGTHPSVMVLRPRRAWPERRNGVGEGGDLGSGCTPAAPSSPSAECAQSSGPQLTTSTTKETLPKNVPVNVPNSRPNRARIATRQKCRSREALWLNNLREGW
jgi:hypothetical protein